MRKGSVQYKKLNISEVKIDLNLFIHIFCFISVLLIGADMWGINIGVNLRLDQLFLTVFAVLLAVKGVYQFKSNFWIMIFAAGSLISVLFAVSKLRAFAFWFSIIYNVVVIFYGFASYVRYYGIKTFIGILRATFYVQFTLLVFQYLLMVLFGYEFPFMPTVGYHQGVPRFRLWFYEPSYFATYLIFWLALSVYMYMLGKDKSYFKDIIFCLVMLLLSTSTAGFLGIALVVVTIYVLWLLKGVMTIKKLLFPLLILLLFLAFKFIFPSVYELFFVRLFNMSLNQASGGRVEKWAETFAVFKQNMLFGVGPGNYGLYLGEEAGYTPTNVSLDLLATLGLVGFIAFYGLTVSLMVKCIKVRKKIKDFNTLLLVACAYGLLIFTIVLQANQGYLRLYHWMFFGILWGGILKYGKRKKQSQ